MKSSTIVICVHLKISALFMVSHFFIAKRSLERRLNLGFRTQEKCPFPVNRGVLSMRILVYIVCLISIGLSLSDEANKLKFQNIEGA